MTRYYRDFYGSTASVMVHRDNTATLTISTYRGNRILRRTYNTDRGARIAMGQYSDSWREVTK